MFSEPAICTDAGLINVFENKHLRQSHIDKKQETCTIYNNLVRQNILPGLVTQACNLSGGINVMERLHSTQPVGFSLSRPFIAKVPEPCDFCGEVVLMVPRAQRALFEVPYSSGYTLKQYNLPLLAVEGLHGPSGPIWLTRVWTIIFFFLFFPWCFVVLIGLILASFFYPNLMN